jgi:hypothetical protein
MPELTRNLIGRLRVIARGPRSYGEDNTLIVCTQREWSHGLLSGFRQEMVKLLFSDPCNSLA